MWGEEQRSGWLALDLSTIPVGWQGEDAISAASCHCPDLGQLSQVGHNLEERIRGGQLLGALHHDIKLLAVDCEPVRQDACHLDWIPIEGSHLQSVTPSHSMFLSSTSAIPDITGSLNT